MKLRFLLTWFLAAVVSLSARAQNAQDSLARIYPSVVRAGNRLIVDAGDLKALFTLAGKPLTTFLYEDLRPGLNGDFIANDKLLNADGQLKSTFKEAKSPIITDTIRGEYRSFSEWNTTPVRSIYTAYNAAGKQTGQGFYPTLKRTGLHQWDPAGGEFWGIRGDFKRDFLLPVYKRIDLDTADGILATTADSAFVFSPVGKPRFKCKATAAKLLKNGIVAVEVLGMWGLRDTAGRRLTEYEYTYIYQEREGGVIRADYTLFSANGHHTTGSNHDKTRIPAPGYIELYYRDLIPPNAERYLFPELRDANLNLLFPAGDWERAESVGSRFVQLYRAKDDLEPQIWDLSKNRFSLYLVEKALGDSAYLVWDKTTGGRKILKGDSLLPLPYFTVIFEREKDPFYFISHGPKWNSNFTNFARGDYALPGETLPHAKREGEGLTAVLNADFEMILPPVYNEVKAITTKLLFAYREKENRSFLFSDKGALISQMKGKAVVERHYDYVSMKRDDSTVYTDTTGKIFYSGANHPSLLFTYFEGNRRHSNFETPRPGLPQLLLYADSLTGKNRLHNLEGKVVNENDYKYPRGLQVPGMFSLQRGDSLYYVNTKGQSLFKGQGFGIKETYPLEGCVVIVQNKAKKWGVLGADGKPVLSFIFDSLALLKDSYSETEYALCKGGKWALLNNLGQLRYPLQGWKPSKTVDGHSNAYYKGSDSNIYKVVNGLPERSFPRKRKRLRDQPDYLLKLAAGFRIVAEGKAMQSNIATDKTIYTPFFEGYYLILVDTPRKRIAMFDNMGNTVIAFRALPEGLIVNRETIVIFSKTGYSHLYQKQKKGYSQSDILIDTPLEESYRTQIGDTKIYWTRSFTFTTPQGERGLFTYEGKVFKGTNVQTIVYNGDVIRVQQGHRWGMLNKSSLKWIHPPTADSIIAKQDGRFYEIYQGGKQGFYMEPKYEKNLYIPPLFEKVINGDALSLGYITVKESAGYRVLDESFLPLTPWLDTLGPRIYLPYNEAILAGKEVSLRITDSGTVAVLQGENARVKRFGPYKSYRPIVQVQQAGKWGLWNNETAKMIVAPVYDTITPNPEYRRFMAQKSGTGTDSFFLLNEEGNCLWKAAGKFNPVARSGFWFLGGSKISPVINASGVEIIPAGYEVEGLFQNRFFKVWQSGRTGFISKSGVWLVPPVYDSIDSGKVGGFAFFIARKSLPKGQFRYALISFEGQLLTETVYKEIRFEKGHLVFKRNKTEGFLNSKGAETSQPWPAEED